MEAVERVKEAGGRVNEATQRKEEGKVVSVAGTGNGAEGK